MGWFDEQLRERRMKDDENFADAMDSIADAVMGQRLKEALDSREITQSAIGEILKYYHHKPKDDALLQQDAALEEQLEFRLRPYGMAYRPVALDRDWYRTASGAMLGTLREDGSAVALIPGRISGYTYLDRETGRRVRIGRKNAHLFADEAFCFYQPLPMKSLGMVDLLKFMLEQLSVSDIFRFLGLTAMVTLLGLLTPLFSHWLFGDVLASGNLRVLLALAGFMVCFSVSRACFTAFQALVNAGIGIRQNIAVQAAVMNRIMSLPAAFFRDYASGELAQRAFYVQAICSTMFNTIGALGLTSLFSLVYIGQIFLLAPSLAAPALTVTIATLVLSVLTTAAQVKVNREKMRRSAKTSGLTYATITGIQKIKLAGAQKRMFTRWARLYSQEASLEYNPPAFLKLSGTIGLLISLAGTLILYALAIRSGTPVSDYYAFSAAYGMVSSAFMSLSAVAANIANIRPALEMAAPILETAPEMDENRESVTRLRGEIELNHVSFRYDESMPNVIDDLSLKIRPGEYVAIVGPTGCGKSTLLRLLLGFEKPQKGGVYYDGRDLARLDVKSLRRRIGAVMQDGKLFLGDIFSNITVAAPHLTLDEAWEAAETAAIADEIRAMPMGMSTVISEGQGGISGGQRQRLMIARAVAPKPKILLFDEATSALDNVTQKKVTDAVDALKCTRIVIAHRLSTIRRADRILYLDQGKIAEEGTYEELIEKNGAFAALVARQRIDTESIGHSSEQEVRSCP